MQEYCYLPMKKTVGEMQKDRHQEAQEHSTPFPATPLLGASQSRQGAILGQPKGTGGIFQELKLRTRTCQSFHDADHLDFEGSGDRKWQSRIPAASTVSTYGGLDASKLKRMKELESESLPAQTDVCRTRNALSWAFWSARPFNQLLVFIQDSSCLTFCRRS